MILGFSSSKHQRAVRERLWCGHAASSPASRGEGGGPDREGSFHFRAVSSRMEPGYVQAAIIDVSAKMSARNVAVERKNLITLCRSVLETQRYCSSQNNRFYPLSEAFVSISATSDIQLHQVRIWTKCACAKPVQKEASRFICFTSHQISTTLLYGRVGLRHICQRCLFSGRWWRGCYGDNLPGARTSWHPVGWVSVGRPCGAWLKRRSWLLNAQTWTYYSVVKTHAWADVTTINS